MAVQNKDYAYFYNSEDGDRVYDADSMTDWLLPFFTSGVFNGNLQVTANDDMSVTIDSGYCNIKGKTRHFVVETKLDLEVASGTLNRIDSVVLRRDDTKRNIYITIVTGGNTANPIAPELVRNNAVYDLKLAEIYIKAGAIKVTQTDVTDCRMDATVCGWVASTVKEIDFEQITAQFKSYIDGYKKEKQEDFDKWFTDMKNQLTNDAAGLLQTEFNTIEYPALNGVMNLAPIWEDSLTTIDGITYSKSMDKNSKYGLIHAIGKVTGDKGYSCLETFLSNSGPIFKAGTYIISGCPDENTDTTKPKYEIELKFGTDQYYQDYGKGTTFTLSQDLALTYIHLMVFAEAGEDVDIIFQPMLEKGKIAHAYVPYSGYENLSDVALEVGKTPIDVTGESTLTGAIADLYKWNQLNYDNLKTDALMIDTKNKDGQANRPAYVANSATKVNMPAECSAGVWKCGWINTSFIVVEIEGVDMTNRPTTWLNRWNGSTWSGWYKTINSGNISEQKVAHAATADTATNASRSNSAATVDTVTGFSKIENITKNAAAQYYLGFDGGAGKVQCVPYTTAIVGHATTADTATNASRSNSAATVDTVTGFSKIENSARSVAPQYYLGFDGGADKVQCVPYATAIVGHATKADRADNALTFNGSYGPAVACISGHRVSFYWDGNVNKIAVYVDITFIGYMTVAN